MLLHGSTCPCAHHYTVLFAAGLAVVWDMLLTSHFLTLVMVLVWQTPVYLAACFYAIFATIEALYFSASAEKVPTGKQQSAHVNRVRLR